jgi:hypothetical protein
VVLIIKGRLQTLRMLLLTGRVLCHVKQFAITVSVICYKVCPIEKSLFTVLSPLVHSPFYCYHSVLPK